MSSSRHSLSRRPESPDADKPDGDFEGLGEPSEGSMMHGGRASEEYLALRRREANRLAAQRFRSRKKGYQESLEEKVRQLEGEKEILMRRLDGRGTPPPGSGKLLPRREGSADNDRLHSGFGAVAPRYDGFESASDMDVRLAALESANRRLQDEVKVVGVENQRLSQELDMWRRWGSHHHEGPDWAGIPSHGAIPRPFVAVPTVDRPYKDTHGPLSPSVPPLQPERLPLLATQPPALRVNVSLSVPPSVPPLTATPDPSPSSVRLPPIRLAPPDPDGPGDTAFRSPGDG